MKDYGSACFHADKEIEAWSVRSISAFLLGRKEAVEGAGCMRGIKPGPLCSDPSQTKCLSCDSERPHYFIAACNFSVVQKRGSFRLLLVAVTGLNLM